ncbi:MAG: type II toxin-antitoxin system RelE/ParE family toxin [Myxococcota bacterium]
MKRRVLLAPEAVKDLEELRAFDRARVKDELAALRADPTHEGKSRVKRLRGLSRPRYRLRVGEVRVFYDVTDDAVEVLAIVAKVEAKSWLEREGKKE